MEDWDGRCINPKQKNICNQRHPIDLQRTCVKSDNEKEHFSKKITVKELKVHIMKTPNKAPGDSIHPQHLKIGSRKLYEILTILYNASLDLGYFANNWKISVISMIIKPNKPGSL